MRIALLPVLLFASSLANAQSIQPGLWRATTGFALNGVEMPKSEDERCVSAAEAKDVRTGIAKELQKKGCVLTQWSVKRTKLQAALKCKSSTIDAQGQLSGTVTLKSYDLKGEAEGTFQSIPTFASVKMNGRWVKACK